MFALFYRTAVDVCSAVDVVRLTLSCCCSGVNELQWDVAVLLLGYVCMYVYIYSFVLKNS